MLAALPLARSVCLSDLECGSRFSACRQATSTCVCDVYRFEVEGTPSALVDDPTCAMGLADLQPEAYRAYRIVALASGACAALAPAVGLIWSFQLGLINQSSSVALLSFFASAVMGLINVTAGQLDNWSPGARILALWIPTLSTYVAFLLLCLRWHDLRVEMQQRKGGGGGSNDARITHERLWQLRQRRTVLAVCFSTVFVAFILWNASTSPYNNVPLLLFVFTTTPLGFYVFFTGEQSG